MSSAPCLTLFVEVAPLTHNTHLHHLFGPSALNNGLLQHHLGRSALINSVRGSAFSQRRLINLQRKGALYICYLFAYNKKTPV